MQAPCIFGINQELTWYLVSMVSAKNPDPPFGDQRQRPETACKSFKTLAVTQVQVTSCCYTSSSNNRFLTQLGFLTLYTPLLECWTALSIR